ncbi:AAA family ATPase [Bradyrhizobium manausense]|uniref:AAA family ATPase n=1 Tax=Bradyrhizobium manausense TaxID=989370 RepID=UPI001BAB8D61|nr:AAA family ATPase [Bradyrhizobium manausense]MBR0789884.1 AAA family ATPase [Bradyrhizobium manausense]
MSDATAFANLNVLADYLRHELENKKFVLLYAYNGTGKTRLSTAFKDLGKSINADGETISRDTLYFNAFTEDLFSWDNDLANDSERKLKLNTDSSFFAGLESLEMDNRIRTLLSRYADFEFRIDTTRWEVVFEREFRTKKASGAGVGSDNTGVGQSEGEDEYETRREEAIKVSRGEENIFIWCFFLAIVELALDDDGTGPYNWVKHLYIDDPISSLDEHNAIAVANHLAKLLKRPENRLKTVISTHHTLFFNVLCNELNNANKYFLSRDEAAEGLLLRKTGDTPFFHHVATLAELYKADRDGKLCTHHFNMLRAILEKTASFHGYPNFSACIKRDADDEDGILHTRLINILSHGNYSLYEPQEMLEENKRYFRKILHEFVHRYPFNPALFPSVSATAMNDAT